MTRRRRKKKSSNTEAVYGCLIIVAIIAAAITAFTGGDDAGSTSSRDDGQPQSITIPSITPRQPTSEPTAAPTATPQAAEAYTAGTSRIRSCPQLTCDIIDTVGANVPLAVLGTTTGDNANGSAVWHEIEYNGTTAYIHSSLVTDQPITLEQAQQQNVIPTITPANAPRIPRPGNCSTAVAMNLSAEQAAQWSHLDRDSDGVACYGD